MHACYRLQEAIPEVAHIIQASLNVDARNEQTEMETLLDMVRAVEMQTKELQQSKDGGEIDWDKVLSAVSHNLGAVTKYAKILLAYVKVTPAELIYELGAFFKANSSVDGDGPVRHMGSEWLLKLAGLNFGKFEKFPLAVNACFKANLTSCGGKLVDGYCKLISLTALSGLTSPKLRADLKLVEQIMVDARELSTRLQLDAASATTIIGQLDVRLILHLLKLSKFSDKEYRSVQEIGQACACFCLLCDAAASYLDFRVMLQHHILVSVLVVHVFVVLQHRCLSSRSLWLHAGIHQ